MTSIGFRYLFSKIWAQDSVLPLSLQCMEWKLTAPQGVKPPRVTIDTDCITLKLLIVTSAYSLHYLELSPLARSKHSKVMWVHNSSTKQFACARSIKILYSALVANGNVRWWNSIAVLSKCKVFCSTGYNETWQHCRVESNMYYTHTCANCSTAVDIEFGWLLECGHRCHNKQVCGHLCCKSKAFQLSVSQQAQPMNRQTCSDDSQSKLSFVKPKQVSLSRPSKVIPGSEQFGEVSRNDLQQTISSKLGKVCRLPYDHQ